MDKIYFISGLGADKRVFSKLRIDHPFQKHIEWETPLPGETISNYSKRLIGQIDQDAEVILIGVSFGGIIAQEIAKLIMVKKLVIISSIKNSGEMNWQLQLVRKTKLHKIFSASVLQFLNKLTANYYFGIQSEEENRLLLEIINDTDLIFMKWAINEIMDWDNTNPVQLLHIHGTKDKIFPCATIKSFQPVINGGHWMIYNRAPEISQLINQYMQ